MAEDLLKGFDLFNEQAKTMIQEIQDVSTKKEMLNAMAKPIVDAAKQRVREEAEQQTQTLENGIVVKISTDGSQALIGWTEEASYGANLENGFRHVVSHEFIKLPHLRPALISKRNQAMTEGGKIFYRKIK